MPVGTEAAGVHRAETELFSGKWDPRVGGVLPARPGGNGSRPTPSEIAPTGDGRSGVAVADDLTAIEQDGDQPERSWERSSMHFRIEHRS